MRAHSNVALSQWKEVNRTQIAERSDRCGSALVETSASTTIAGYKFRRQHPVGPYIADFCCVEERLIIEVDGGQHSEQAKKELSRTDFLRRSGYRVVRFWNNDVLMNLEAVLDRAH